jgi:hypothetical protein
MPSAFWEIRCTQLYYPFFRSHREVHEGENFEVWLDSLEQHSDMSATHKFTPKFQINKFFNRLQDLSRAGGVMIPRNSGIHLSRGVINDDIKWALLGRLRMSIAFLSASISGF